MRRLPVPGEETLPSDADFVHIPSPSLGLRIRAREERAATEDHEPAALSCPDDAQVLQWADESALEELD